MTIPEIYSHVIVQPVPNELFVTLFYKTLYFFFDVVIYSYLVIQHLQNLKTTSVYTKPGNTQRNCYITDLKNELFHKDREQSFTLKNCKLISASPAPFYLASAKVYVLLFAGPSDSHQVGRLLTLLRHLSSSLRSTFGFHNCLALAVLKANNSVSVGQ